MTADLFMDAPGQPIDLRSNHVDQLASKVIDVFNFACDADDLDAAQDLLRAAEAILSRQRLSALEHWDSAKQGLVDAHYRLWEMRYLVR